MSSEPSDDQKREALSLFERGQHAFDSGSYNEALADFSKGLQLYEASPTLRAWRGITLSKLRRYEEALSDMSYLLEHDTVDTSAKIYPLSIRGAIYCGLDRHEEALADFTHAIELQPRNPFLFLQRGMIFDLLKRFEETLADLTRAIELGLHDPVIHEHQRLLQAMLHGDEQHLLPDPQADLQAKQQSLNALTLRVVASTRLIEQRRSHDGFAECYVLAEVFVRRAEREQARNHFEEMVLACTRAIELGSSESIVFYLRGYILSMVSGQDEQVLFDWKYARTEVEMGEGSLHRRGKAHLRLQHYQEALADFEQLIQRGYRTLSISLDYASALLHLHRYQEALSALNCEIKLDNTNAQTYVVRANVLRNLGQDEKALDDYLRAIELGASNPSLFIKSAQIYADQKRYAEVVALLTRFLERESEQDADEVSFAYYLRGDAFAHMHHYSQALDNLNRALELRYENEGWIPFQRALIYKQTGRENEFAQEIQLAISLGQQVAQVAPHDQRLALNLALYLLAAGQQQEAWERYARVLAQKPSRERLEMAIEDLESWLETQPSDAFARTTLASIQDLLTQAS